MPPETRAAAQRAGITRIVHFRWGDVLVAVLEMDEEPETVLARRAADPAWMRWRERVAQFRDVIGEFARPFDEWNA